MGEEAVFSERENWLALNELLVNGFTLIIS